MSVNYTIGIDEAGRGPLAGPVVAAAVALPKKYRFLLRGIRDSKKLSAHAREEWFLKITRDRRIFWAASRASPAVIDRINIARAADRAARRAHKKLCLRLGPNHKVAALLDAGLSLSAEIPHKAIIKGDEKIPEIAAASVIAKVIRDRAMARLHRKFPMYGFAAHKGYGTRLHAAALAVYGASPAHRASFAPVAKIRVI